MNHTELTFGLDAFGDLTIDSAGSSLSTAQVLRDVVAEGVRADDVGIDHFNVGEHHRPDFAISSPEVVLAAIAARTERITLGSARSSRSGAARSSSPSRCSATTLTTIRCCSRRSSTCSQRCGPRVR